MHRILVGQGPRMRWGGTGGVHGRVRGLSGED